MHLNQSKRLKLDIWNATSMAIKCDHFVKQAPELSQIDHRKTRDCVTYTIKVGWVKWRGALAYYLIEGYQQNWKYINEFVAYLAFMTHFFVSYLCKHLVADNLGIVFCTPSESTY